MELTYNLSKIEFAQAGNFAFPRATVRIELSPCPTLVVPAITVQIRLADAWRASGLAGIAAEALAQARQLVPETAAQAHLQALVDEELQLQAESTTRSAAAMQAAIDAAAPPSGG